MKVLLIAKALSHRQIIPIVAEIIKQSVGMSGPHSFLTLISHLLSSAPLHSLVLHGLTMVTKHLYRIVLVCQPEGFAYTQCISLTRETGRLLFSFLRGRTGLKRDEFPALPTFIGSICLCQLKVALLSSGTKTGKESGHAAHHITKSNIYSAPSSQRMPLI